MNRFLVMTMTLLLSACGFHPQGEMRLADPLKRMHLQTPDPYGSLARNLRDYLRMSHVKLVACNEAQTNLVILHDDTSQELLSVSGTQQTRQYNLKVNVAFEITNKAGHTILPAQSFSETRAITVQSNQILGSSNEANLYYQQMRRSLAYAIMTRLSSLEVTDIINHAESVHGNHRT